MKKRRTSKGKGRRTAVWLGLAVLLAAAGFVLMRPATDSVYRQMYPRKYSHYIEQYSREYGVDKNLVYAVTRIESNFDPQAVSSADARGLMQMTSDAFDWVQYRMGDDSGVSYEQIFEPKVAIRYVYAAPAAGGDGGRKACHLRLPRGYEQRALLAFAGKLFERWKNT